MNHGRRSAVVLFAILALFGAGCDYIARPSQGAAPNDPATTFGTFSPALSGDGRFVAFSSVANDLVPGDDNNFFDIFVRDLRTGAVQRASVSVTGGDPDADSGGFDPPSLSADGRYVAFTSSASNLVAGDGDGFNDVFVRDLQLGTTIRVSVDTAGGDPNGLSNNATISADGHLVAFVSPATDLVAGDGTGGLDEADVFVRDLLTGVTTRVSVDMAGGDADARSETAAISANGRFVAFTSNAADLVPGDAHRISDQGLPVDTDVFVRDLQTRTTTRASVNTAGATPNERSFNQDISADGRFVVFSSDASDLVPNDALPPRAGTPQDGRDVFLRDLESGVTTRISIDRNGSDANLATNGLGAISDDGRFVTFDSEASDLINGDTNGMVDVFVRDLVSGITTRQSVGPNGEETGLHADGTGSFQPAISGDGHYVAFVSADDTFVSGDQDRTLDVFVRAAVTPTIISVSPTSVARGTTGHVIVKGHGFLPGMKVELSVPGGGAPGITVTSVTVDSEKRLTVNLTVAPDATTGARNLVVFNPGTGPGERQTSFGRCNGCLTIT